MKVEIFCDFVLICGHFLPNVSDGHPCKRQHGHNYLVRLFVEGGMNAHLGWVIDYAELRQIWVGNIHAKVDHQNLNGIDGLQNPTCELFAEWIAMQLEGPLTRRGCKITRLEIREEPTSGVVFTP